MNSGLRFHRAGTAILSIGVAACSAALVFAEGHSYSANLHTIAGVFG